MLFCCRNQIYRSYGDKVTQRKERYTQEDKDLLQNFLSAKEHNWGLGSNSKELTLTDGRSEEKMDQTGNNKLHNTKVSQRGSIRIFSALDTLVNLLTGPIL